MEIGLDPGDIALDGDPALLSPKRGQSPAIVGPCLLWPNGCMGKMPLGMVVNLGPGHIVLDGDKAPIPKGDTAAPIFVVAKLLDGSRCHLVRR